mmetsp:Transcript_10001/g.12690  ORF Transcript_10001/g.12690 Transcript_10001/m.12690 type:complete len:558 (+) Transcript_10001:67-1740(+)
MSELTSPVEIPVNTKVMSENKEDQQQPVVITASSTSDIIDKPAAVVAVIEDSPAKKEASSVSASTSVSISISVDDNKEDDGSEDAIDTVQLSCAPLTYSNVQKSSFYVKAKDMLQTGEFELALSKIEAGITALLSLQTTPDEMHESVAPLYYLYGTTLLYSIEESQENPENSMLTAEGQSNGGGEDTAGDLQIAWENLETARNIMTRYISDGNNNSMSPDEKEVLMLDLAQVYARLGDLSRHDGHYERAISDYQSCCETRRNVMTGDKVWDRKIADVEYSLGMTCLLLAAEAEKNLLDQLNDNDSKSKSDTSAVAASLAASMKGQIPNNEETKVKLSPEEITSLREKSARHYVQCSRILTGIIAVMCGNDPTEIAAADSNLEVDDDKKMSAKLSSSRGEKTSGLDAQMSIHEQASAALKILRERVSKLKPNDVDDGPIIHDLREMLDEIQETIDTCEKDREGLRDVTMMRKKAEEEVKRNDDMKDESDASEGATTTIGFASAHASASQTTSAFAGAKSVSLPTATPMMVVKKKKKKRDDKQEKEDENIVITKKSKTE